MDFIEKANGWDSNKVDTTTLLKVTIYYLKAI